MDEVDGWVVCWMEVEEWMGGLVMVDWVKHIKLPPSTHKHSLKHSHRHTNTQTYKHTNIQIHRHTNTQTYKYTDIQTHGHHLNVKPFDVAMASKRHQHGIIVLCDVMSA